MEQSFDDEEAPEPAWSERHLPMSVRFPWAETALTRIFTAVLAFWLVRIALTPLLADDPRAVLTGALVAAAASALWPPLGSAVAGAATVASVATVLATNVSFPLAALTALALAAWWAIAGRTDHLASAAFLLPAVSAVPVAGTALAIYALEPVAALATGMGGYLFAAYFSLAREAGFAATPLAQALSDALQAPELWVGALGCGLAALMGSAIVGRGSVGAGIAAQILGCAVTIAALVCAAYVENDGIWTAPDAVHVACAVSLTVCLCIATALRGPLQGDEEGDDI